MVTLHHQTRLDAAEGFGGIEHVPVRALTMGMATILEARSNRAAGSGPAQSRRSCALHWKKRSLRRSLRHFCANTPTPPCIWTCASRLAAFEYSHPWNAPDATVAGFRLRRRALISVAQKWANPLSQLNAADLEETACAPLLNKYYAGDSGALQSAIAEVEQDLKQRTDDEAFLPRNATVMCPFTTSGR
jgi:glucosamine-6-phosphate deaminase